MTRFEMLRGMAILERDSVLARLKCAPCSTQDSANSEPVNPCQVVQAALCAERDEARAELAALTKTGATAMSVNIPRRRRWAEQIIEEITRLKGHENLTSVIVDGVKYPSTATLIATTRRRLCLAILRRVRRCPECLGRGTVAGITWSAKTQFVSVVVQEDCRTCKGTGKL
jgi:hypothetical protein